MISLLSSYFLFLSYQPNLIIMKELLAHIAIITIAVVLIIVIYTVSNSGVSDSIISMN